MLPVSATSRGSQRKREPGQRPREFDQSVVQAQYHRTHIGQPHSAGQVGQILPVALFLRSDPNELLPLGIQGITRLRAFFTQLHLPDDKSRPQHPHYPHIPENPFRIGSHFASRPALQDRAMPSFVVHDTHQGLPANRVFFQFGQPAVDFAQGGLLPLKVQKVFCRCIHICVVIPPKASGTGSGGRYNPESAKNLPKQRPNHRRKKVLPRRTRSKKNPSPPYCVFCRNIHPPAFPIHPKVFFMA